VRQGKACNCLVGRNLAMGTTSCRPLLTVVGMLLFVSCGGSSSSSSTGPSAPQTPSVLGTWTVTYSAVSTGGGVPAGSTQCPGGTLSITAQSGGAFSGTIIITGSCAHASNVTGQMDSSGVVSTFVLSSRLGGLPSSCSVLTEPPFTGRLVGNALTVTSRNSYRCLGQDVFVDRTLSATR